VSSRARVARATVGLVVALVASGVGYATTFAAFSSDTGNTANSYSAGTVFLTGNGGSGSFSGSTAAEPGADSGGCVTVTYGGSLPAQVRLYATTTGDIAPYLTVRITRGSGSADFPACTDFTADSDNYAGLGAGVLYQGTVAALPTSGATGLLDPTAGDPETWTTGEAHSYRYEVTVSSNPAGQSRSGTVRFGFQASNT
jgi:hypothetical protein